MTCLCKKEYTNSESVRGASRLTQFFESLGDGSRPTHFFVLECLI